MGWGLVAGMSLLAGPRRAEACGGLFCDSAGAVTFPVAQAGEGIVFAVDRESHTVQAIISVQYQGEASDFAWVLPLQSAPLEVDVVPAIEFNVIDRLTRPTFPLSFEDEGICHDDDADFFPGNSEDATLTRIGEEKQAPGVEVISQQEVGPYDSAVIQSSDPAELRTWLEQNGYFVDDRMMESVTPYVSNGDVLLALKLHKDNDVGDIQPVVVKMAGDEVCVPIRLTAIAALDDMEITTLVLSNEGRAIPENYNHVTLNLLKLDWLSGGSNYSQIVAQAADEGSGNAFTTEFAGDALVFRSAFYSDSKYDRGAIESSGTVSGFMFALQNQGLLQYREIVGILVRHIPDSAFVAAGTTKEAFRQNPQSFTGTFPSDPFDAVPATQEIWERIVEREAAMQEIFDQYRYATRLYTLISPDEMTIDPTFVFDRSQPDVTNVHPAKLIRNCGIGGNPDNAELRVEIQETGQVVEIGDDRRSLDAMPSALTVEQLDEGRLISDNSDAIAKLLGEHNRRTGCGCSTTEEKGGPMLFALLGLAFVLRSRRT
jgi:MYXO-CTERM domain-containing protein